MSYLFVLRKNVRAQCMQGIETTPGPVHQRGMSKALQLSTGSETPRRQVDRSNVKLNDDSVV